MVNCMKHANITAAQIRAARALLDWSRDRLSAKSGVSVRTLVSIESDTAHPRLQTLEAIKTTLSKADILFIEENGGGQGVRLKKR